MGLRKKLKSFLGTSKILWILIPGFFLIIISFGSGPYPPGMEKFLPGCIECHTRVFFEIDGIGASRFSKGTHPIGLSKIRPLEYITEKYKKYYKMESLSGDDCRFCHTSQYTSWKHSAHGKSFSNAIFQHAFGRDKLGWCLNCHAPLWEPSKMDPAAIATNPDMDSLYAKGITCTVCHLRDSKIISNTDFTGKEYQLYHEVVYDPDFGNEQFCAGCHQFNFVKRLSPIVKYETKDHPMQNVVHEYQNSNGDLYKSQSCRGCHYANGDHSLKSEAKIPLKQKILLTLNYKKMAQINSNTHIQESKFNSKKEAVKFVLNFQIKIPKIAHHFPTGDLFRILTLYVYDENKEQIGQYDFRKEVRVVDRKVIQDTTLKPKPGQKGAQRSIDLRMQKKPVFCELVYRLQGNIESEIEMDFPDKSVLREVIYKGSCIKDSY